MKRSLFIIAVINFALLSCKKTGVNAINISGKWELRTLTAAFVDSIVTFKAGNGTIYQFNRDSTYNYYVRNKINAEGVYHIKKIVGTPSQPLEELVLDNSTLAESLTVTSTELTISTRAADGFARTFQKIN